MKQKRAVPDRMQSHVDFCSLYVNKINHAYSLSKAFV